MSSSEAMLAIAVAGIMLQSLALVLGLLEYRRTVWLRRPKKNGPPKQPPSK